jgi:hypothetical protein
MERALRGVTFESTRRRRAVVIGLYASYLALIACFAGAGRSGFGLVLLVALLPTAAVLVWSFMALSQIALPYASESVGVKLPELDERQLQVRDRAFYRAYQVLSSVAGLWIVYETIARTSTRPWFWVPVSFDEYQALVWGYLLLAMTLPSAVIAWTEPDPVTLEDGEVEWRVSR